MSPFISSTPIFTTLFAVYCCNQGDTWSSEIGILSKSEPFSILPPFNKVPRGTNGGVSLLGLGASIVGGWVVGIGYVILSCLICQQWIGGYKAFMYGIILSGIAGLGGSAIDSVLGAKLQYSGYNEKDRMVRNEKNKLVNNNFELKSVGGKDILTNDQVNFISSAITGVVMLTITLLVFFVKNKTKQNKTKLVISHNLSELLYFFLRDFSVQWDFFSEFKDFQNSQRSNRTE